VEVPHFSTDRCLVSGSTSLDQNVIDKMLHDWGQELRRHRNLAAHATGTWFTRRDAEDIFDFAQTICEYVFVLTRRFERFKERARLRKLPRQADSSMGDAVAGKLKLGNNRGHGATDE
jgi:hypothetical protein